MSTRTQEPRPARKAGDLCLRTSDHPEANGRRPLRGEEEWTFDCPLDDGRRLWLSLGRVAHDALRAMLLDELEDDIREGGGRA